MKLETARWWCSVCDATDTNEMRFQIFCGVLPGGILKWLAQYEGMEWREKNLTYVTMSAQWRDYVWIGSR